MGYLRVALCLLLSTFLARADDSVVVSNDGLVVRGGGGGEVLVSGPSSSLHIYGEIIELEDGEDLVMETVDLSPGECLSTELEADHEFAYNISVFVVNGPSSCLSSAQGLRYRGECLLRDIEDFTSCKVPGSRGITSRDDLCSNWGAFGLDGTANKYKGRMCTAGTPAYFAVKSTCSEDMITVKYKITTFPMTQTDEDLCELTENFFKAAEAGVAMFFIVFIAVLVIIAIKITVCIVICCYCPGCPLATKKQKAAVVGLPRTNEGYQMMPHTTAYASRPSPTQQYNSEV